MSVVPQAGAIVFTADAGGVRILLVRAKKTPDAWVFPKGHLVAGESHAAAALREAGEEAGAEGAVVGLAGPALEFQSGEERVRVEYYLVSLTRELPSPEGREKHWYSPDDALARLAHDEARALLRAALPEIESRGRAAGLFDERFSAFLIAEYEHLAESLLKNEESGESRVSFFMALCGGMGAVLGFVLDRNRWAGLPERVIVGATLSVLILLGYITFMRVVTRNAASDRYKQRLSRIRQYFVTGKDDQRLRFLAFDPFETVSRPPPSSHSFGRGGWLETVALVIAIVVGALGSFVAWWVLEAYGQIGANPLLPDALVPLTTGALAGYVAWRILIRRGQWIYAREAGKG